LNKFSHEELKDSKLEMHRTLSSWKRASKHKKAFALEVFRALPVGFDCDCVKCYDCGDTKAVEHTQLRVVAVQNGDYTYHEVKRFKMNYCPKCGRPKISGSGKRYGLKHTKYCNLGKDKRALFVPELWEEEAKAELRAMGWELKEKKAYSQKKMQAI